MAGSANSIITPQTPKSAASTAALTANTNYLTPTSPGGMMTAGPNGARLTRLIMFPAGTVTQTQCQLFRSTNAGVTKSLAGLVVGAAGGYTMAQTTAPPVADFGFSDDNPMILAAGELLYVAVGVSGTWSCVVEWADY